MQQQSALAELNRARQENQALQSEMIERERYVAKIERENKALREAAEERLRVEEALASSTSLENSRFYAAGASEADFHERPCEAAQELPPPRFLIQYKNELRAEKGVSDNNVLA